VTGLPVDPNGGGRVEHRFFTSHSVSVETVFGMVIRAGAHARSRSRCRAHRGLIPWQTTSFGQVWSWMLNDSSASSTTR